MKKSIIVMLCLLMAAGFAVAGGRQEPQEGPMPIKLEVWDWQPGENYVKAMAENMKAFMVLHPEVELEHIPQSKEYWMALKTSLLADEAPDIFGILRTNPDLYHYMENLRPIIEADPEWMAQQNYIDSPDIWTGEMLVSIAIDAWYAGVYYYKDMLTSRGLKEPVTVEDYLALVPVFAKDNIKVIAQGGDWWVMEWFFYNMAQQLAPDNVNVVHDTEMGKFKWTDEWFRKSLTAFKKLYDGGIYREDELQLGQFAEAIQSFQNKRSWGFWMGGTWWAGSMNPDDLAKGNIGMLPVPLIDPKSVPTLSTSTGQPYGLPKAIEPEKRDMAIAFLKYLSSPAAVKVLLENDILPAAKVPAGVSIKNSLIAESVRKGEKIRAYNMRPINGEISQTVGDQLSNCLLGNIDLDGALKKIAEAQAMLTY